MNPSERSLRHHFVLRVIALLACAVPLQAADRKPNFLFIYTDGQRWDAMGVVQREQGEKSRFPARLFGKGLLIDGMALNIDLAPTFLDLAGVPIPLRDAGHELEGTRRRAKPRELAEIISCEYFRELGDTPTCVGIRTTGAKLVNYADHLESTEIFDLAADPYELKNLAADPSVAAALSAEFDALVKAVN